MFGQVVERFVQQDVSLERDGMERRRRVMAFAEEIDDDFWIVLFRRVRIPEQGGGARIGNDLLVLRGQ